MTPTQPLDSPAWISLFVGLYLLAVAVGEFRKPGTWLALADDLERSPAISLMAGLIHFALGTTIYLVTPLRMDDWLSVVIASIGGLSIAKGLLMVAAADRLANLSRTALIRAPTFWPGAAAAVGAAFLFAAVSRL